MTLEEQIQKLTAERDAALKQCVRKLNQVEDEYPLTLDKAREAIAHAAKLVDGK